MASVLSQSQSQSQSQSLPSAGMSLPHPHLPSPSPDRAAATRQSNFEQAIAYALHLWPALSLAVQNGWGGEASADKRDWFAGAVVDLFPALADGPWTQPADEPDVDDVEEVLLQVMADEFDVDVDDDSAAEVARIVVSARAQCALGQFGDVDALRERFSARGSAKVQAVFKQDSDADQDSDWDTDASDDEDEAEGGADVVMDDAPPLATVPKDKPGPQVDQDGFTMVTKKKK
ncbi:hypothetical protein CDD80_3241 [Ophiocordyceps camponoti-rufipedis]|uniref:Pre-rRNA-processing protein TSR2 n=1 Tax=Ophiocordyceps camponoti-rufipedis TaxID=2004952 RepID=A0A2C5Z2W1_9HYPO|nr:hypothetical protein CDD80_3241 [Ophiocordyceps camponoti-rufipedis]